MSKVKVKGNQPAGQPAPKKGRTSPSTPAATKPIIQNQPQAPIKNPPQEAGSAIATSSSSSTASEAVEVGMKAKTFFLKFSTVAKPFNLPRHPEVALVAMQHFQQEGMKCIPFHVRGEKCYKIELRDEVDKNGHILEFQNFQIPLPAWEQKTRNVREEGLLLTFRRAGVGDLESVPAEAFDQAMNHLKLEMIVTTKMQRIKDTRVLNGNRFCVVKTPANLRTIPESIPVEDPVTHERFQVNVTFKGQERYCYSCNEMHIGLCPKILARIEAEKEKKALGAVTSKIYSDSTLRGVDVLGLRSEVLAMSGGGLGQIIQAVMDDPSSEHLEKVVIVGGKNDSKTENFVSNEHFAANVDLSLSKLVKHAKEFQNKTFCLVQQVVVTADANTIQCPTEAVRELYLLKRMTDVAAAVENIETVAVQYEVDETGHPTTKGTEEILKELHQTKHLDIWNNNYISTEKPYSRVEAVYRYGCNGCEKYGTELVQDEHANQLVCDTCFTSFNTEPNELLQAIEQRIIQRAVTEQEKSYPSMET